MRRFGGFLVRYFLGLMGLFSVFSLYNTTYALDQMDDVFLPSKQHEQVLDFGNNKNAVGNEWFKPTYDAITGKWKQPLVIRVIKMILQVTMVLGVTMGIFTGVQYVYSQGDEKKIGTLVEHLWKIAIGIILALSAYAIIELAQSVTRSSIVM